MVELVEVEDEAFEKQDASSPFDEGDFTDTGMSPSLAGHSSHAHRNLADSEISTDDEDDLDLNETLLDRLVALRDIIPPSTRSYISDKVGTTSSWISSGLTLSGKTLWVVGTSVLFLGVPYAVAFADEQQVMEMEKEMRMREMGGEVSIPEQGTSHGEISLDLAFSPLSLEMLC